jgi:hypothetical protein
MHQGHQAHQKSACLAAEVLHVAGGGHRRAVQLLGDVAAVALERVGQAQVLRGVELRGRMTAWASLGKRGAGRRTACLFVSDTVPCHPKLQMQSTFIGIHPYSHPLQRSMNRHDHAE